jgi:hypothetical protein
MHSNTINHNALMHLAEADAISSTIAKADGDIWTLAVHAGNVEKTVMAKNSGKPRVWRKLDTLAKYLKDIGVEKFEINISQYDPSQKSLRRPDSANILKRTHKSHKDLQHHIIESPKSEVKVNATDQAIEIAKKRWEARRAKILQEENPRAK